MAALAKVQVPAPLLVREVAPVLSPMIAASEPLLAPVRVRVRAPVPPLKAIAPVLLKVRVPALEAEESMVPPLAPRVKRRFVEAETPVYFKVPPLSTRLA